MTALATMTANGLLLTLGCTPYIQGCSVCQDNQASKVARSLLFCEVLI